MSSTFDNGSGTASPPAANDNAECLRTGSNGDSEFGRLPRSTRTSRRPTAPEEVTSHLDSSLPVQAEEVVLLGPLVEIVLKRLKAQAANDN